jgi:hypothetical protein
MANINNVQSFPRFPQLPKEVRLMIWEMALPCLRIVSVEMRWLKKTHLEWEQEKEVSNKTAENTRDSETMPEASRATSHNCECPRVDPPLIDGHLPGIKLNTPLPQILLTCCKSFAAATKFYKCVFSIDPSSPETYFNFYQDTLYIRHNTFSWYSEGTESIIDSLVCFSIHNNKELNCVKNLTVLLDPKGTVSVKEWLVRLLCFFQRVERLLLVVQHYHQDDIASPLCLIKPIDVDAAWLDLQLFLSVLYKQDKIPEIPSNGNIGLADVDLEVLRVAIEAEMGQDYVFLKIECGVIVTQDFKEYLDSLLERGLDDSG